MKAIKVLLSMLALLVIGLNVSGHGYIFAGMQETYFRGWKNSNIDDIEFGICGRLLRQRTRRLGFTNPSGTQNLVPKMRLGMRYMSAAFLVLQGDTLRLSDTGKASTST